MFRVVSCAARRRRRSMAGQDDEIQLVHQSELDDFGEDGNTLTGEEDGAPCMKINYSDTDESEPRVQDERHIKHPGKFRMRLRVRTI